MLAAKLWRIVPLKATQSNETRWSCPFEMSNRFIEIHPFIKQIDDDEIRDLLPTDDKQVEVKRVCKRLNDLNSVTNPLNRDSITLFKDRILFEAVLKKNLTRKLFFSDDSSIVENTKFESAISKIQNGVEIQLRMQEKIKRCQIEAWHNASNHKICFEPYFIELCWRRSEKG